MMIGKRKCPKCGEVQDSLWKYCQKCGAEIPRPVIEQSIYEKIKFSWTKITLFVLGLVISVGFGIYGFVLFNTIDTATKARSGMTTGMGLILIAMAGISLILTIRSLVKYLILTSRTNR